MRVRLSPLIHPYPMITMKRFWLPALLLFSVLLLPAIGYSAEKGYTAATQMANLADPALRLSLRKQAELGQSAAVAKMPDETDALRIGWDNGRARHFEFSLPAAPVLPEFTRAKARVRAYVPADNQLRSLSIRLRDKFGEVFQISAPVTDGAAGWRDFYYDIDTTAPFKGGTWGAGDKANQQMDFPLRFLGMAGDFKSQAGEGWIGLEGVTIIPTAGGADFALKLETGNPIHVLVPGAEAELGLAISNIRYDGADAKAALQYKVLDVDGQVIAQQGLRQLVPAGGEGWFVGLPVPEKLGIYYVEAEVSAPGGKPLKTRVSYSYMQPAGPEADPVTGFLFGLCSHPQRNSLADQRLEAMAASWAGARIVREDIGWQHMQPAQDTWNFTDFDDTITIFGEYGIELQVIFSYLPGWAVAKDWTPLRPERVRYNNSRPDYDHWRTFIRTFAERYGDRLRYVEVWNEPDLVSFANFTTDEYIEMLRIAYGEIKSVHPDMVVLTGGFAGVPLGNSHSTNRKPEAMPRVLDEAREFYDVIAIHGHGPFSGYLREVEGLLRLRGELGLEAVPWYANETAVSSSHVGEKQQAVVLFQKLIYSWANGAIGYNWYDLRNDGFDGKNIEHNFGLITRDFYPKAGYPVFNMLAGNYASAEFVSAVRLEHGREAYLFKDRNGDYLIANWLNEPAGSNLIVLADGVTGKAERIDLFGNVEPVEVSPGGMMVMEVGKDPSTYRIRGGALPPVVRGQVAVMMTPLIVVPGETSEVAYEFRNPTDAPLTFNLGMRLPEGLRADGLAKSVTVRPRGTRTIRVGIAAGTGYAAASAIGRMASLDISIPGVWSGKIDSPIKEAFGVPVGDFNAEPTFTLDRPAQVTSLVLHDPTKAHLHWRDADDLSAKVWLAWADDALLLKAVVKDDRHFQPNVGGTVWQGDNIQFVIGQAASGALWELGLTHAESGTAEVFCWAAPDGVDRAQAAAAITLETTRDERAKTTTYLARLPLATFGMEGRGRSSELRFNLIVNDNDGEERKGFIGIAPGLGLERETGFYPVIYSAEP